MVRQRSLLWEFNNGNSGSGYLFGSIHINTEFVHSLLASLEPYIKGVDIVATEIHLDEVHQNLNPKYFSLPSGNSYQDYWSFSKIKKYELLIQKSLGFSLQDHCHLNPIILLNLLSLKITQSNLESSNFDELIWDYSKGIGKEMSGLEDINYHFDHLLKMTILEQFKMLDKALRNIKLWRRQLTKLLELYNLQETPKIYQSTKRRLGKLRKPFLYERNQTMVNALDDLLKRGSVFASVGASHFDGQFGMLKLLKDKNYKLRPVILKHSV